MEYLKFQTNIPLEVEFKFDQGIERDNKFKPGEKQYNYGVMHRGVESTITVTPRLNDMLQELLPLAGKSLQILKYEDGTKKLWKILDIKGNDVTPQSVGQYKPKTPTTGQTNGNASVPPEQFLTLNQFNETLDKQRAAFRAMQEKVDECVRQVEYFKTLWKTQNPEANKVHEDAIPIIGENDWASETSEKLFDK